MSERVIEDGDMVVLDFGGLKDGYGSDTTRSVHVGEPTDEERKVYEIVKAAQQAAFEAVRPGVACQEIDRAARKVITDAGYGEYFIHRVGHGIGLTTHEPPYMVEGEEHLIEPGMCFSIEPGIYLPGKFGVRIEDIVVATSDGGRRLNNTSHELRINDVTATPSKIVAQADEGLRAPPPNFVDCSWWRAKGTLAEQIVRRSPNV